MIAPERTFFPPTPVPAPTEAAGVPRNRQYARARLRGYCLLLSSVPLPSESRWGWFYRSYNE